MSSTNNHQELRVRIEEAARFIPTLELSFRSMFGGVMIYSSGKPFASLAEPGLALKLSEPDRAALLREPGAEMLRHDGEAPSKQYVVVPPHILEDAERLSTWIERSVLFVTSLPVKKKTAK